MICGLMAWPLLATWTLTSQTSGRVSVGPGVAESVGRVLVTVTGVADVVGQPERAE